MKKINIKSNFKQKRHKRQIEKNKNIFKRGIGKLLVSNKIRKSLKKRNIPLSHALSIYKKLKRNIKEARDNTGVITGKSGIEFTTDGKIILLEEFRAQVLSEGGSIVYGAPLSDILEYISDNLILTWFIPGAPSAKTELYNSEEPIPLSDAYRVGLTIPYTEVILDGDFPAYSPSLFFPSNIVDDVYINLAVLEEGVVLESNTYSTDASSNITKWEELELSEDQIKEIIEAIYTLLQDKAGLIKQRAFLDKSNVIKLEPKSQFIYGGEDNALPGLYDQSGKLLAKPNTEMWRDIDGGTWDSVGKGQLIQWDGLFNQDEAGTDNVGIYLYDKTRKGKQLKSYVVKFGTDGAKLVSYLKGFNMHKFLGKPFAKWGDNDRYIVFNNFDNGGEGTNGAGRNYPALLNIDRWKIYSLNKNEQGYGSGPYYDFHINHTYGFLYCVYYGTGDLTNRRILRWNIADLRKLVESNKLPPEQSIEDSTTGERVAADRIYFISPEGKLIYRDTRGPLVSFTQELSTYTGDREFIGGSSDNKTTNTIRCPNFVWPDGPWEGTAAHSWFFGSWEQGQLYLRDTTNSVTIDLNPALVNNSSISGSEDKVTPLLLLDFQEFDDKIKFKIVVKRITSTTTSNTQIQVQEFTILKDTSSSPYVTAIQLGVVNFDRNIETNEMIHAVTNVANSYGVGAFYDINLQDQWDTYMEKLELNSSKKSNVWKPYDVIENNNYVLTDLSGYTITPKTRNEYSDGTIGMLQDNQMVYEPVDNGEFLTLDTTGHLRYFRTDEEAYPYEINSYYTGFAQPTSNKDRIYIKYVGRFRINDGVTDKYALISTYGKRENTEGNTDYYNIMLINLTKWAIEGDYELSGSFVSPVGEYNGKLYYHKESNSELRAFEYGGATTLIKQNVERVIGMSAGPEVEGDSTFVYYYRATDHSYVRHGLTTGNELAQTGTSTTSERDANKELSIPDNPHISGFIYDGYKADRTPGIFITNHTLNEILDIKPLILNSILTDPNYTITNVINIIRVTPRRFAGGKKGLIFVVELSVQDNSFASQKYQNKLKRWETVTAVINIPFDDSLAPSISSITRDWQPNVLSWPEDTIYSIFNGDVRHNYNTYRRKSIELYETQHIETVDTYQEFMTQSPDEVRYHYGVWNNSGNGVIDRPYKSAYGVPVYVEENQVISFSASGSEDTYTINLKNEEGSKLHSMIIDNYNATDGKLNGASVYYNEHKVVSYFGRINPNTLDRYVGISIRNGDIYELGLLNIDKWVIESSVIPHVPLNGSTSNEAFVSIYFSECTNTDATAVGKVYVQSKDQLTTTDIMLTDSGLELVFEDDVIYMDKLVGEFTYEDSISNTINSSAVYIDDNQLKAGNLTISVNIVDAVSQDRVIITRDKFGANWLTGIKEITQAEIPICISEYLDIKPLKILKVYRDTLHWVGISDDNKLIYVYTNRQSGKSKYKKLDIPISGDRYNNIIELYKEIME